MPLKELQTYSSVIGDDVFDVLSVDGSVAARNHPAVLHRSACTRVAVWRQRLAQRAK